MTSIAYVAAPNSNTVHVSISTEKWLGADLHTVTVCGRKIESNGMWREVPRPTETGMESDYRRCKQCERKRIGGYSVDALAFDYEEKLARRYAQCDETCTTDCGPCKGSGRPAHVPASVPDSEVDQYLDFYPTKEA